MPINSGGAIIIAIALIPCVLKADHADLHDLRHDGSTKLQRVKTLTGTWKGIEDIGHGKQEVVVNYKVTAGGSAVVETMHPDTPMEMVSVYHDEGDKIVMTHYCMLGNHPMMKLSASDDKSITLGMVDSTGLTDVNEPHMHNLKINFVDADTIEHQWTFFDKGKSEKTVYFKLRRSK